MDAYSRKLSEYRLILSDLPLSTVHRIAKSQFNKEVHISWCKGMLAVKLTVDECLNDGTVVPDEVLSQLELWGAEYAIS